MVLGRCVPRVLLVMPFTARSSCSLNNDTLCFSVMQENVVCTDCIYTLWNTFASEESSIAEVVNYCVSSSPSPSPSLRQALYDLCFRILKLTTPTSRRLEPSCVRYDVRG